MPIMCKIKASAAISCSSM
uniref:Uncharacterized protein n=1 Tax=Arundo donax TaxID=35708 RepID=A0A0A8ZIS8_ARUDO